MKLPPKVTKRRTALLEAGKKRPTFNLFGHGKKRKLAAEEDDDETLKYALLAAAGLAGAAALAWAYKNPEVVNRAVQYFGMSPKEVASNGGLPDPEPPRQGIAAQDAEALAIAEQSGDDGLVRFVRESIQQAGTVGDRFEFDFSSGDPADVLTSYIDQRTRVVGARTSALVDSVMGKGQEGSPEQFQERLVERLGLDPSMPEEQLGQAILEALTDPNGAVADTFVEADEQLSAKTDFAASRREAASQLQSMEVLRQAYAGDTIPYRGYVDSTDPAVARDMQIYQAAMDFAQNPEGSPYAAVFRDMADAGMAEIDPAEFEERVAAAERNAQAGSLDPEEAQLVERYGAREAVAITARMDALGERFTAMGEEQQNALLRQTDTAYIVAAAEALADPEVQGDFAGGAALAEVLRAQGVDPSNPGDIRAWAASASPEALSAVASDAGVLSRQALAVRHGFSDASGAQVGTSSLEDARSIIDIARSDDATLRANFTPGVHAMGSIPDWADPAVTWLSGFPGLGALGSTNIVAGPAMGALAQQNVDATDPNAPGRSNPLDRARYEYSAAIQDRMRREQEAVSAGDLEALRTIRAEPMPEMRGLSEIAEQEQANTSSHMLTDSAGLTLGFRTGAPFSSTRQFGALGSLGMTGLMLADGNMREQIWENPGGTLPIISGELMGMTGGHYAMRYAPRTMMSSGNSFRFQGRGSTARPLIGSPFTTAQNVEMLRAGQAARAGRTGLGAWARQTGAQAKTRAAQLFQGRTWANGAARFRDAVTGGAGLANATAGARLANRGAALLRGLGRGAAQYAQFNTILAGGRAVGELTSALFDRNGAADNAYRQAYLGTIGMNGRVAERGGRLAILADLTDVPLMGDYSNAQMASAATSGFNYTEANRSGSILGDWIIGDLTDDEASMMATSMGYRRAMIDLSIASVMRDVNQNVMPAIRQMPMFQGASAELLGQMELAISTAQLEASGLDDLSETDYVSPQIVNRTREATQERLDFAVNPEIFADPYGTGFIDESMRYLSHVAGGNEMFTEYLQGSAIQNILANTPGVDPGNISAADASAITSQWLDQKGLRSFRTNPVFSSAYRQHDSTYGVLRRQVEAAMESSPNLRHISPERQAAIMDAAMQSAAQDYQRQLTEWREAGIPDSDIMRGYRTTADGSTERLGLNAWMRGYSERIGATDRPTNPFAVNGEAGAVEADFRDFLSRAVGDDNLDLLDSKVIDAEIDSNSGMTFEQRNNVPGQGLFTTQASERNIERLDSWRESVRAMGGSIFDQWDDPIWAAQQEGLDPSSPEYQAAWEQRLADQWDPERNRERWQVSQHELARQIAEQGGMPTRYTYDWDELDRTTPLFGSRSNRELGLPLEEFAGHYHVEYDAEGNPTLVGSLAAPEGQQRDARSGYTQLQDTMALAAANPYAFAQQYDVPVEQVMLALEEPRLREQLATEGGFRVFDATGAEEVVPTWGQARARMMQQAGWPERRPGSYQEADFRPPAYSTWERIMGRSSSTRDANRAAHAEQQAQQRAQYELTPEQYQAALEARGQRINRYEQYFSPEMQQYRGQLADWQNQYVQHNERLGHYGGTPDVTYQARFDQGLIQAPAAPQSPWLQQRRLTRPAIQVPTPVPASPAPKPVQTVQPGAGAS